MLQITVAGGVITAVTPAPGVTRAERWRTLAGLGTMATQNASAVAITGGTATGLSAVGVNGDVTAQKFVVADRAGSPAEAVQFSIVAGSGRFNLYVPGTAQNYLAGQLGVGSLPTGNVQLTMAYPAASRFGMEIIPTGTDTGAAVLLRNAGLGEVGSIRTTATTTSYNTTSDVRLKEFVQTLVGALDVVRALRPVSFHWQADGSQGRGFLAHELMHIVPEAVTGLPDEVHPDGSVKPQQVDHSRLVVFLVGAAQDLAQQLDALAARVTALEEALGV